MKSMIEINDAIVRCKKCPRLIKWCQAQAKTKVKRFESHAYWGKPVPGFGDIKGKIFIVGLAPAAHGANRTGRMFTGDRSGLWLYRALYKAGFSNQADSNGKNDGLRLNEVYISAVLHCAPPQNKPNKEEIATCSNYLNNEYEQLKNMRVIIALGKIAFDNILKILSKDKTLSIGKKPSFLHGAKYTLGSRLTLIASYHPSQQNTFTGRLTEPAFDQIFHSAKKCI